MKIILDAMGGDNAPEAVVLGALDAAKDFNTEIILVGRGEDILAAMEKNGHLTYTAIAGEDYFVMAERPYAATSVNWVNFYRMDWLKAVGYDHIPIGREEYKDAMLKIKAAGLAEYPGGGAAFRFALEMEESGNVE